MPWWGWIIVGVLLLGSELLVVDAAFYLVFIGIAAVVTGLVELAGVGLEPRYPDSHSCPIRGPDSRCFAPGAFNFSMNRPEIVAAIVAILVVVAEVIEHSPR